MQSTSTKVTYSLERKIELNNLITAFPVSFQDVCLKTQV